MASTFYLAPTANFIQKTLNGTITDSATTVTLNNATNLQAPGIAVINRTDTSGTATPNAREVVAYTGISGNDLTGVTRGFDNSTARSHGDGSLVEFAPAVGMWNSLATVVSTAIDGSGYIKAIPSPVSISRLEAPFARIPSALVSIATVLGHLNLSGASLTGLGIYPVFSSLGNYSGPTVSVGGVARSPRVATLKWVSATTRHVVSTASIGFDFKIKDTTVFSTATMRPAITAGGTYVSTASIATANISQGDLLSADIASVGTDGFVTTITIQGGAD